MRATRFAADAGSRARGVERWLRDVRLEYAYLTIAIAWGILQGFIVPPLQVPDEGDHFFRAWAVSTGQATANTDGTIAIPGYLSRLADVYLTAVGGRSGLDPMPKNPTLLPGFTSFDDLLSGVGPPEPVKIPSRVANYGPEGYLPQAAAIAIGRAARASPLVCFYLARLANLLVSVALVFLAIRLSPYGREVFLFVALLPMTMFELASVSCDATTIAGALLFVALALRAARLDTLTGSDIAVLILGAAFLLNIKPGYWALILATLLIKPLAIGGVWRRWALLAACLGASALVFYVNYRMSVAGSQAGGVGGSGTGVAFVMGHPLEVLWIIGRTLKDQWLILLMESVGILGWFTITLPGALYVAVFTATPMLVFREMDAPGPIRRERLVLAGVAVAVFLTFAAILYAFLSPPGIDWVGLQGRYFVPVWLMLLLSLYGIRVVPQARTRPVIVGIVLALMVVDLQTLIVTYS